MYHVSYSSRLVKDTDLGEKRQFSEIQFSLFFL